MLNETRIVIVLLALALAAVPAWMAGRMVSGNLQVLKSWQRVQGVVVGMAETDSVELELGGQPDGPRVKAPITHQLGLSFLKKVPVYLDPADPQRARVGGLFQMWIWPAGLALAGMILLAGAGGVSRLGTGVPAGAEESQGRWMFSPPPPPLQTGIRVYRPASEWKAPLGWSLLGAALLLMSLFLGTDRQVSRTCAGAAGLLFLLLMWGLSWNNRTTEISADASGMRKTTAFGWCQIRWEQVGSVAKERTIFGRRANTLRDGSNSSFPGRDVTILVFADKGGGKLIGMSPSMQPADAMQRLLELCAQRTGLHLEFRTLYERNL